VPESEIKARLADWQPPEARIKKGYMARYANMVSSASQGAIVTGD
jgi:dihydroxy-acid dehydratase